jgi:hypothetical protein
MGFPLELNFHGLRRSTHNRLLSASVTRELADWLTGHDDQSEMFTLYAGEAAWPTLQEAVGKISYGQEVDQLVSQRAPECRVTVLMKAHKKPQRLT